MSDISTMVVARRRPPKRKGESIEIDPVTLEGTT
jgi:hypothetical protein